MPNPEGDIKVLDALLVIHVLLLLSMKKGWACQLS
jgi:hypothetical protein